MGRAQGFQFKQFFIEDEHCGMKVGTDSIMLGSWLDVAGAKNILDIGTGSGILALMLAQKSQLDSRITGIDIDPAAVTQASKNGRSSPWSSRLAFSHTSLQQYHSRGKFDLIISNPPYFESDQQVAKEPLDDAARPSQQQRKTARQTTELSHQQLLQGVANLLSQEGRFACILPAVNSEAIVRFAARLNLHCYRQLLVRARPQGKIIRHLLEFKRQSLPKDKGLKVDQLFIYQRAREYSQDYMNLCNDYYLKF